MRFGVTSQDDARGLAKTALGSLPTVERRLCGAMIMRQLDRGPRTPREVEKYGPEGCVKVCSARALQVYLYPVGIATVAFAVAGMASVAIALFVFVFVIGALGVARAISASKAGKRWRSSAIAS